MLFVGLIDFPINGPKKESGCLHKLHQIALRIIKDYDAQPRLINNEK